MNNFGIIMTSKSGDFEERDEDKKVLFKILDAYIRDTKAKRPNPKNY